jgi:DNA-binding NtrC family response regulator
MGFIKSILIVDDEANLRSTLSLILKRAGYLIHSAANFKEALDCLSQNNYDLLFLDVKMPGMNGLQLLPEIRRLDPNLPVLILTANPSLEDAVDAERKGAFGYMLKPVEPEQIVSRVHKIFQERKNLARRQYLVNEIKGIIADLNEMEI